jgi:hypothetical protein
MMRVMTTTTRLSAINRPAAMLMACAVLIAVIYAGGLLTGAITLVGYETRKVEAAGMVADHSGWQTSFLALPAVWLSPGRAIRVDYDVAADFGALALDVSPPLLLKTPLQTATAYVAGQRSGSVLFVAKSAGFYRFYTDPTPIGGPRCHPPGTTMLDIIKGQPDCPSYRMRYTVSWHLADPHDATVGLTRLSIPSPNETLAAIRIGN